MTIVGEPIRTKVSSPRERLAAGLAAQVAGEMDAARDAYRAALSVAPEDPLALGLLGSLEGMLGNAAVAERLLRRAAEIDPANDSTLFNLGVQQRKLNQPLGAARSFEAAVALRPDSAKFHRHRAEALALVTETHQMRQVWRDLLAKSEQSVLADAGDLDWRYCLGLALLNLERAEEALEAFTALLAIDPRRADAHVQQGVTFMALRRFAHARESFERALKLDPALAVARLNLGNALLKCDKIEAAISCFREMIARDGSDASIYLNLATTLREAGRLQEALACFDRAIVLRPGWRDALIARAYCLLGMGHLERGWAEHEHRLSDPVVPWVAREFGCPQWDGVQDIAGRTVLVWAEQGFGDAIHFSRYAIELARLGARVVLEAHPPLVRLFRSLAGVHRVLPFGEYREHADFHCALMSLPHLLDRRLTTTPSPRAYLAADNEASAKWAMRVASGINIGLAWTGNPLHSNDHRRSMSLPHLRPHLTSGVRWWCVQKHVSEADQAVLDGAPEIAQPPLGDFADTAGLISRLDAVVTVDTSVAHLAAALGRPTFVMLPYAAEWRWQTTRADSPWYESARLFRQPSPGDWDSVLRAVMNVIPSC